MANYKEKLEKAKTEEYPSALRGRNGKRVSEMYDERAKNHYDMSEFIQLTANFSNKSLEEQNIIMEKLETLPKVPYKSIKASTPDPHKEPEVVAIPEQIRGQRVLSTKPYFLPNQGYYIVRDGSQTYLKPKAGMGISGTGGSRTTFPEGCKLVKKNISRPAYGFIEDSEMDLSQAEYNSIIASKPSLDVLMSAYDVQVTNAGGLDPAYPNKGVRLNKPVVDWEHPQILW